MEEEMKEEHDHPNRREPDEGEVKKVETDKWTKRLAKRIRKGKKESESAKSEGASSDDDGFKNEKRKKSLTGVKKKNAGNTLSKSQSFTSKVLEERLLNGTEYCVM